jgi:Tetratricopeptide repeat.
VAYGNFGDTEKSLEYGQKALTILRELYGEVHKDIANSLNNLAVVYIQLKDYKKAESYLLQSLAVNKEIYGDNQPSQYATLYSNLGFVYCGLGRKKDGRVFYALCSNYQG